MRDPYAIVRGPLVTEKTTDIKERVGTVCFRVAMDANKVEIRRAIERIYKVKVGSVRTALVRGKMRRMGRFIGKRPNWRKAYVTLKPGEKPIEYFD